jgi:hypothetical protein
MLRERGTAYGPEELSLLGEIFDQVVASIPPAMRTPINRAQIAKNILERAAIGESDPIELELAASANLIITSAA